MRIAQGDRIVVTGASGSGKTTVAKALVNLWDEGSGVIAMPKEAREHMMMISQRASFPNTTLRGILNMTPDDDPLFEDEELADVLKRVGHDRLIQHIPGMQIKILMEDLSAKLAEMSTSYNGKTLGDDDADQIFDEMATSIDQLVAEQFDVVQYVSEELSEAFKDKISQTFDVAGVDADSRLSAKLADRMTSRINRALLQPALDHMDEIIPNIVNARNGLFGPYRKTKTGYFMSLFKKRLRSRMDDYMANKDTDEVDRIIPINDEQAKILQEYSNKAVSEEFNKQSRNTLFNKIADFVTWPLSLMPIFSRVRNAAREITESNTFFMERQILKGGNLTLSGGELQRLMIARALLHRPKVLILDEITAALDTTTAQSLYKQMMDEIPKDTTVISIAHNEHIWKFHTHRAHLENQKINMQPI